MLNIFKHRSSEYRKRLSEIIGQRLAFEVMMQRAQAAGDTTDAAFVENVLTRIKEIERKANDETCMDELEDLVDNAEDQGQLRAYICPVAEIQSAGTLAIDTMREWNVPTAVIAKLRGQLGAKVENADANLKCARSALRDIFDESDSWSEYTESHEKKMLCFTYRLVLATTFFLPIAVFCFHYPLLFPGGLLCAGIAGSCVSVMAKMPTLEVRPSGELETYPRRILSRIGLGVTASLIGCAFFGILPIAIKNVSFADVLSACTIYQAATCTNTDILTLLAVPMLFGFSERALTSIERQVLQ